jgi:hypothetical protein
VPDQRTFAADIRAVLVSGRGVPWWGAVLIAATATLIGLAIEAGSSHSELGGVFAACYALGCIAAVLAVRRSGIFTAVVQPPLLLFVAVPLAYYLFHESSFSGLKDILITCGYPLIERFPLMLFTTAAALLIGLVRWYLAMHAPAHLQDEPSPGHPGVMAGLSTKVASAFAGNGSVDEDAGTRPARPRHLVDRPAGARRSRRPQERTSRSRHARPPADEFADAPPRQRSRRTARAADRTAEPRRRDRDTGRTPPPREPVERRYYREPIPPRPPRGSRFEPYESGRGYQSHPQYGAYPPPAYRPDQRGGPDANHHPVSRVRYRDGGPPETPYDAPYDGNRRGR